MKNFTFSIITPLYKTPDYKISRLYNSLLEQTYNKWEWIVYDDSPSYYFNSYNFIKELSKNDKRIKIYKGDRNIGNIGKVKKIAFSKGNNDILVEVDHDDELVDTCLENLNISYNYDNEIGFVYGNACEIYENSDNIIDYGDNWAFGYGNYMKSIYKNKVYKVAITANINPKTIRHITAVPNHVRSWRKDIYEKIGGHDEELLVADDYELIVRTFLNTKMAKMNVFSYIQNFDPDNKLNTQFKRNADIQEIVDYFSKKYNNKIHDRLIELNINDYIWNEFGFDTNIENPEKEEYANIIIPNNILKINLFDYTKIDIYAYSRVYDIKQTLEYKKTEHYTNFIKWLIKLTNCKSYLELGIEYGINIENIKNEVDICVGVDIKDEFNTDGIEFYKMTTDDFFKENNKNFDIIFIDANHDFKQVKKDFDNSLKILNKYGIIIIHDTDPIIEYLTRKEHCNDSYKIIDYLNEKEDLNIINLPIQETGLTLIMRKNDRRIFNFLK
jgi:predicted O-methyltransferase YrrM